MQLGYVKVLGTLLGQGSPGAREALRSVRVYGALHVLVVALSIRFGFFTWLLLLWSVPAAIAQGLLVLVFDWLPHHPHVSRERYRDTRVTRGRVLEVLLLGQSYHLVHHLYPRLPFYRYSSCFEQVQPLLVARGATIDGVRHEPRRVVLAGGGSAE